ncbi:MAG: hypothetical protein KBC05_10555 [Candidatus Hydrogenedentes bacterium]|nr:hypothetical protein [Candidatus Hydrogenedentota bacterium]
MKKAILFAIATGLLLSSGCATVLTNQLLQRQDSVRVEVEGKSVMVGVDLFALDEIGEHPFIHGFAAVLDIGAGYLVYDALEDSGGSSSTHSTTAYTIQTGDNSPVYFMENSSVNNNQSSAPAPAPAEETAQRARRAR